MTDDEKAECVAAAMRDAKVAGATGTPPQRKMAYRLAIWNAIEKRISVLHAEPPLKDDGGSV